MGEMAHCAFSHFSLAHSDVLYWSKKSIYWVGQSEESSYLGLHCVLWKYEKICMDKIIDDLSHEGIYKANYFCSLNCVIDFSFFVANKYIKYMCQ